MATEYGTRLRAARKYAKLTQLAASKKTGIPQSTISTAERLGNGSSDTSVYAQAYGVNAHWITTGEGRMELNAIERVALFQPGASSPPPPQLIELENNPDFPSIRRVRIKAQAGVSGYAVEYMNDDGPPIVFRKDWYTANHYQPEKMLALRITGDSMIPALYSGDLIVVNTLQMEPKDGIAFVVAYEGEIIVKRLVRDDGQWWITSDNPDQRRYPRKKCNGETQIIGEVVYRQTERI
jgi:phage repressor protein C with HTH and peptisase S24 domain